MTPDPAKRNKYKTTKISISGYEKSVIVMCNTQQLTIVGLCRPRFTSSDNIMPKLFEKLGCNRIDIVIEK